MSSLQALVDAASSGATITLSGSYTDAATVTISKPLTIVGRATASSGSRPTVTISTAADQSAITINASNVTLRGFTVTHNYASAGSTTSCITLAPGGTPVYPDAGLMTNENITIDDCRVEYGKFGVTSKAKNFSVLNSEIHCRFTTSSTARAIAIYSQDGTVTITGNTYTTAGNLAVEGLHHNFATNDSFINKRNGKTVYSSNSNNFNTSRKWVFFEVGAEKGVSGDKYELEVQNNTISATGSSFVVVQPSFVDSLDYFTKVTVSGNTVPATFTNGIVQIDATYGSAKTHNTFTTTPLFYVYGNTAQTGIVSTGKVVLENVMTFTAFTSTPANTSAIISTSAPVVNNPIAVAINDTTFNTASSTINVSDLIGAGSTASGTVQLYRYGFSNFVPVVSFVDNSLTNSITLNNSSSIPYTKGISIFQNPVRQTISSKATPLAFAIKFIDTSDLTQLISSPGEQQYTLSIPSLANRQYLEIYRENTDGSATFVTNATLDAGQTYSYSFTLSSNSVYSIADSGVLVAGPGVGSDPHITTLSGRHWVMNTIRGKNRKIDILSDGKTSIQGHIQGYKLGDYMSNVTITNGGEKVCEIDFNHLKIKINNETVVRKISSVDSSNLKNSNNSNKRRQMIHLNGLNPGGVYLYVDLDQRYVCPIFNQAIQNDKLHGVLI